MEVRSDVRSTGREQLGALTGAGGRARRVTTPSWRDPRLLIGLALVLGSVVAGARTVAAAQSTTGVYALAGTVGAGSTLSSSDLRVVQVHVDAATAAAYVGSAEQLDSGWVVLRGLPAGELLPRSALARAGDLTSRSVSLHLDGGVPEGVREGGLVDVWVTWTTQSGTDERPQPVQVVEAAEVAAAGVGPGGLSARSGADVSVLVPRGALPDVLQAVATGAVVAVIPVPGAWAGDAATADGAPDDAAAS